MKIEKLNIIVKLTLSLILLLVGSLSYAENSNSFELTVKVSGLRNSDGVVQFALYNKEGSIPDEEYQHYFRKQQATIKNGSASIVFSKLNKGRYAVNVLHDENRDGKINKGFILPVEGIGFSNYDSIGLGNRPNFIDASFELTVNMEKIIKIIYF